MGYYCRLAVSAALQVVLQKVAALLLPYKPERRILIDYRSYSDKVVNAMSEYSKAVPSVALAGKSSRNVSGRHASPGSRNRALPRQ